MMATLVKINPSVNLSEILMTECAGWLLCMYLTGDPDIVDNNLKTLGEKLREVRKTMPHLEVSEKLDS